MTQLLGQGAAPQMTYTLPPLPYSFDALEPYIDAKTMEIHHDKHHGAYVTNLNKALEGHADLQKLSVEELLAQINKVPENIRTAVRNNGGGHMNHSMFWKIMKKGGGGEPGGDLGNAIKSAFGSFADFKDEIQSRRPPRASAPAGPGCCSATASSPSNPPRIRTIPSWTAARPSSGWMCGSTPTT